jgi:hypothetical protein
MADFTSEPRDGMRIESDWGVPVRMEEEVRAGLRSLRK